MSVAQIARRLKATRQAIGMNQRQFALQAQIPVNTYNQYEQAKGRPSLDFALALCDRYKLTLDWIYRGDMSGLPHQLVLKLTETRK